MSYALIDTTDLTALGDAIRAQTGENSLMTVSEMTTAVEFLSGSSGSSELPSEVLVNTGDISYKFYNNNWNWFLEDYGNTCSFSNITNLASCFSGSNELTNEIGGLQINTDSTDKVVAENMFYFCENLTDIPTISGRIDRVQYMFAGCYRLRNIPSIKTSSMSFNNAHSDATSSKYLGWGIFFKCYSLREVPFQIAVNCWNLADGQDYVYTGGGIYASNALNYSVYHKMFYHCFSLDTIGQLRAINAEYTTNQFVDTFTNCHRLKSFKFYDGASAVRQWKNQTISLYGYIGYAPSTNINATCYNSSYGDNSNASCPHPITGWNSGITDATKVVDATSYNDLKENDNYWTDDIAYSRYNKYSAYETIVSLPDTSAYLSSNGGTNTIIFNRNAGSGTTSGAISGLTAEQIAKATAKGWTVSFV